MALLGVVFALVFAPNAVAAPLPASIVIEPKNPPWVVAIEPALDAKVPEGRAAEGVYDLLLDRQVRVGEGEVQRYAHRAYRIIAASGVESSELELEVSPPYEKLLIHHVSIVRDGHRQDALRPNDIKVIQRETDFSRRIYDGSLTALVFLHDVRVGDVVDYAYSIVGQNPVLGDHYSDTFPVSFRFDLERDYNRLLVPLSRSMVVTARPASVVPNEEIVAGERQYVWDRGRPPRVDYEDHTPRWYDGAPRVMVSEYASWRDVVAWGLPLYEAPKSLEPNLVAAVEQIRKDASDNEARLTAALRFVQREVRYLGIELGAGTHRPESPSVVLERRFGDCKDKSMLLVTLLTALGIEARPALVHSVRGRELPKSLPTPLAFNHVIVRARLGYQTYWLDPTWTLQAGALRQQESLDYENALVIDAGTSGLEKIPLRLPTEPTIQEVYDIVADDYAAPASLRVTTTYRGLEADSIRADVESLGTSELQRLRLNYQAHAEPRIAVSDPLTVSDDQNTNTIVITESYTIPDYWREREKYLDAQVVEDALDVPGVALRKTPLAVEHPRLLSHETHVTLPEPFPFETMQEDKGDEAVTLHAEARSIGAGVTVTYRLQTRSDYVPAAKVAAHIHTVGEMRNLLGLVLTRPRASKGKGDHELLVLGIFGAVFVGIVGLAFAFPFLRDLPLRLRRSAFARKKKLGTGEGPQTARSVASVVEMERDARAQRCACGARLDIPEAAMTTSALRLGTRDLTVTRIACAACGEESRRFFDVKQGGGPGPA